MVSKVVQIIQLDAFFYARGMFAEDELVLFDVFDLLDVCALEMVVHHRWTAVYEGSLFVREAVIPNASWTMCLQHEQWENWTIRRVWIGHT